MENRIVSLFQMNSDRSEWTNFLDEVKKAGFVLGTDYFMNPNGGASGMFKAEVATSPKLKAARKKYQVHSLVGESTEEVATDYIRESTYTIGEKVKVWMGGGKKVLGEIKAVTFGDGHYLVELAGGNKVQRSLHELEPFREGTDKVAKKNKGISSLDEAVERALEEEYDETLEEFVHPTDNSDLDIDNSSEVLNTRRTIINRELGNMSPDEMVDEALNMFDAEDENGDAGYAGYSNCCDAPMTAESDICPACKEHAVMVPVDEEIQEHDGDGSVGQSFSDHESEEIQEPKVIDPIQRNRELVGEELEENHLSAREKKIDFIVTNIDSIPDGSEAYRFAEDSDGEGLIDFLTSRCDDETLDALYHTVERAIDEKGLDYQVESTITEVGEMQHPDEGVFAVDTEQYQNIDALNEAEWEGYLDELKSYGLTCEYNPADDTFSVHPIESVSEPTVTENIFEVEEEDSKIFEGLVHSKGYKFLEAKGTTKEGVVNILVEKNGFKTTISYNDNATDKPWKWEHREFNFIQEALDAVYIPKKFALEEGLEIEAEILKENKKELETLLERRKFADKTTDLSKAEKERREARSQEIVKKFMNDDLFNRKFDR